MSLMMPAIGVVAPVFVVVQALISWFAYSEAKQHGSLSALLVGIAVFVLGVTLAFILDGILEVVGIELLLILLYRLGLRVTKHRSSTV